MRLPTIILVPNCRRGVNVVQQFTAPSQAGQRKALLIDLTLINFIPIKRAERSLPSPMRSVTLLPTATPVLTPVIDSRECQSGQAWVCLYIGAVICTLPTSRLLTTDSAQE